jgi:hypothetical protein
VAVIEPTLPKAKPSALNGWLVHRRITNVFAVFVFVFLTLNMNDSTNRFWFFLKNELSLLRLNTNLKITNSGNPP